MAKIRDWRSPESLENVQTYIETLDPYLREAYWKAYNYLTIATYTLGEDYQIAKEIEATFYKHAQRNTAYRDSD